ncbi:probable E3 ubiquitin ligase complex SCF subunit sconB [Gigantopelta aegis]|uniref:probable E3 ubiquitin ligase complex SCF subunit sconB n=1 Tax=Gigantopelta aegis TaxID=1735272 RepID=UPI001B887E6D|nr:probable E3 ubiquitin ligase complex SCF subunit sconB [Gigantopelta aegis]XP_041358397.1 probable E3 ubiquitin ligase complex SCF subunit sconB [Gigantopelta aegis]XP_041358398.1 probable E3 ubiquitin ligase complex SCF subunit sconB [Gigantopelta aegis]XP_041358399.1 probable E3 ubiquitin ligase complex SCF subunit sconB [Gigantopelta aegis]
MTDILQLPKELQYFILAKIDGISLCMVQRTCSQWRDIVFDLESHFNVWLRCCIKEIPNEIFVKLAGTTELHDINQINSTARNGLKKLHWLFWKQMYIEYITFGKVGKWKPDKTEITLNNSNYGVSTALDFKDNFLVSGHKDGSVVVWDDLNATEHDEQMGIHMVSYHFRDVSDVKVITERNEGERIKVIVSSSLSSRVHITDLMGKETEIRQYFSKQVNAVSVWGQYFVVAANSSMASGQKVEVVSTPMSTEVVWELHGHKTSDLSAVAMWADEIVTGDFSGNLMSWKLAPDQVTNSDPVLLAQFEVSVKYICLQGKNVIILLGDGSISFCGQERVFKRVLRQSLFEVLRGTPDCITLHGPLLAVCVTFGSFYLYYVPNQDCWDNLDLMAPLTRVCTEKPLITAISLGHHGTGPLVAVATDDGAISIYKWRPP